MMTSPLNRLLSKLSDVKKIGNGWSARCPAHNDRRPSLSVSESDDGRVLVDCKAGCLTQDVIAKLGLTMRDLFSDDSSTLFLSTEPRQTRGKQKIRRQDHGKPKGKAYPTVRKAMAALDRIMKKERGHRVVRWFYHNLDGKRVAVVARYDLPTAKDEKQQKTFRPLVRHRNEWFIGGMPEPRPLYHLSKLADADRVYICEGEKAADAVRNLGLIATTSTHGTKSATKTDWSPLAGKQCVILPDNDKVGSAYADNVGVILAKLTPPTKVKVVDLPDLPEGGDIVDWIESQPDADDDELRRQLETLIEKAEVIQSHRLVSPGSRFQPFPIDIFPGLLRKFVANGAKAIGCDTSYIALPLLSCIATSIGNTRKIELKKGWEEPSILWTAIVGDSGTMKSPAIELALQPVKERQQKAFAEFTEQDRNYRDEFLQYERDLADWKKGKVQELPDKPEQPIMDRYYCDDLTIEALLLMLQKQPRGLLMVRDELAGWFASFDRYSQGKGGDSSRWLEMHGGRSLTVDRKTGDQKTIHVPRAAVSVAGGIQPDILRRALGQEHRENGLAARLLLAFPPKRPKRWTEAKINPRKKRAIVKLVDRLYKLESATDDNGELQPIIVKLSPEAKKEWITFFDEHAKELSELSGDLAAAWSKLEGYAARLALVVHFARWAAGDSTLRDAGTVDQWSINAGIRLSRWFGNEVRRIYAMLDENKEETEQRRLVEWIEQKGGVVTAREVQQGHRQYQTAADTELALGKLIEAGLGSWKPTSTTSKGGRPSRMFRLLEPSTVYDALPVTKENEGCVDVDDVDTPEAGSEDD